MGQLQPPAIAAIPALAVRSPAGAGVDTCRPVLSPTGNAGQLFAETLRVVGAPDGDVAREFPTSVTTAPAAIGAVFPVPSDAETFDDLARTIAPPDAEPDDMAPAKAQPEALPRTFCPGPEIDEAIRQTAGRLIDMTVVPVAGPDVTSEEPAPLSPFETARAEGSVKQAQRDSNRECGETGAEMVPLPAPFHYQAANVAVRASPDDLAPAPLPGRAPDPPTRAAAPAPAPGADAAGAAAEGRMLPDPKLQQAHESRVSRSPPPSTSQVEGIAPAALAGANQKSPVPATTVRTRSTPGESATGRPFIAAVQGQGAETGTAPVQGRPASVPAPDFTPVSSGDVVRERADVSSAVDRARLTDPRSTSAHSITPEPSEGGAAVTAQRIISSAHVVAPREPIGDTDPDLVPDELASTGPVPRDPPKLLLSPQPGWTSLGHELMRQVASAMPSGPGDGAIEISLEPSELGRVRMTLATHDGVTSLMIIAERPETLDLMRRHADLLSGSFSQVSFSNLNLSSGSQGQAGQGFAAGPEILRQEMSSEGSDQMTPRTEIIRLKMIPSDRLDLRL